MKVVIVGTGFGERVMAGIYRRAGFETDVVSPRDPGALVRACSLSPDLVSIHSPPFLHFEQVMLALDQKIAVLCDKPFGSNGDEARAMRDRAKSLGVLNFVNFEFRQFPARRKARELIQSGAIGKLQHINWTLFGNGLRNQTHRWLFDREKAGGWIGAYGSHCIDALHWYCDSTIVDGGGALRTETKVRLDKGGAEHASTAEDAFSAWFVMANGITATIDTGFSSSISLPQKVTILGSEGAIELTGEIELVHGLPGQQPQQYAFAPPVEDGHDPGLLPWIEIIRNALSSKHQVTPSFDEGVAMAEAIELLRKKAIQAGTE